MSIPYRSLIATGALFCLPIVSALAQESRGSITGTILDSQGGAILNARVEIKNIATGGINPTKTNQAGYYEVSYLMPGAYTVTADAPGFKKSILQDVILNVAGRLKLDIRMELGAVSETVSVTAAPPLIETTNASNGRVVDKRELEGLPVGQLNPMNVAVLAPGVTSTLTSSSSRVDAYGSTAQIRTHGSLGQNEWSLDGVPVTGTSNRAGFTPNIDAVEEFKLETTSFDAQNGFSIALSVNLTTRSGGNRYHGAFYDQNNQQRWNATPHYNRLAWEQAVASGSISPNTPKQASGRQNNFGVDLGGPVRIPKVYNGIDKLFFYFTFNGIRQNTQSVAANSNGLNYNVPQTDWYSGDFSALQKVDAVKYTVYDPSSAVSQNGRVVRTPFPGNRLPASMMTNPLAKFYSSVYPKANNVAGIVTPDGINNYFAANQPSIAVYNSALNRIDYNLSSKHKVFFKWYYSRADYDSADWTYESKKGLMSSAAVRSAGGADANYVWTLSSRSVVTVGAGITRYNEGNLNRLQMAIKPSDVGLPQYLDDAAGSLHTLPTVSFSSAQSIGANYPVISHGSTGSLKLGSVTVLSRHSLKYGWDERRYYYAAPAAGLTSGAFTFNNSYVRQMDNTTTASNTGLEFASFLMGLPSAITYSKPDSGYWSTPMRALYFQDDWRAGRRLNLTLGIRFERQGGIRERFNRGMTGAYDLNASQPYASLVQAAYAKNPIPEVPAAQFLVRGGVSYLGQQYSDFTGGAHHMMPRFGAAYQIRPTTALRIGYGWFDDIQNANETIPSNTFGFTQPTSTTVSNDLGLTFCCGTGAAGSLGTRNPMMDPFPVRADGTRFDAPYRNSLGAVALSGGSFNYFNRDYHAARQQRWSVGIQHQLGRDMMIEASFNGSYAKMPWFVGSNVTQAINYVPAQYWVTDSVRNVTADNNLTQNVTNPFFLGNLASLQTSNPLAYKYLSTIGLFTSPTTRKAQLLTAFPQMSGITGVRPGSSFEDAEGKAIYRDYQARFEKRFSRGLQTSVMYTHANGAYQDFYMNPFDSGPAWRASNNAPPHRFVWAAIYELPFGKGHRWANSGAARHAFGGWQLSAIYQYQTGEWTDIYNSGAVRDWGNLLFYGDTKDLGNLFKHDEMHAKDINLWFDPSIAYKGTGSIPAGFTGFDGRTASQPGTYQVRTFPGRITALAVDGIRNWDVRVQKRLNFGERMKTLLSVDALNFTNHTQFGGPDINPTSPSFGRVSVQRNSPRFIQAMARFEF